MRLYLSLLFSATMLFSSAQIVAQEPASAGAAAPTQISVMLNDVQHLFEKGDLKAALNILDEVLLLDKNNAEAYAKSGVILIRMGRFHEGLVRLKRAVELEPEKVEYHRSLAHSYEFRSHYDDAIRVYRTITNLAPPGSSNHAEAVKKIAFLNATKLARSGEVEKAKAIFIQLAEKYPDDFMIRYSLGLAYFILRDAEKALVEFERVIELNPRYLNAYLNLASVYEMRGEISLAIESLEKIIALAPESRIGNKARERLGIIEASLISSSGNHQDALDILDDVIRINADSVPALLLMAKAYAQLGRVESAEESYQKVLKLAPNHLEAKSQLAGLYLMSKRTGEAIDLLENISVQGKGTKYAEEAEKTLKDISGQSVFSDLSPEDKSRLVEKFLLETIASAPDNVEAYFKLAQFYLRARRIAEAYEEIKKAAELAPSNVQIILMKAAIASDMGNLDEAIPAYATAVMLTDDPEKAVSTVNSLRLVVARRSFVNGELGIAEKEYKAIITDNPENVMAYYYLGLIYGREEEFLKSIDAYENVVRMSPGNFGARLNLAVSLERLNREEDAISEYRKILQEDPDEKTSDEVKARLFATEKKIKGLSASIAYAISLDNEVNDDDVNRDDDNELRSDMSFNLSYQYKMQNGLRLRLTSSPSYSIYHKGQFDFLNTSNSLAATVTPGKYTIIGGYTNRNAKGLLTEERSSSSDILFTEVMRRAKFRKLTDFFSDERVMTGFTVSLSQAKFDAVVNPIFNSLSYRLTGTLDQRVGDRSSMKVGYTYVSNDNKELEGSDYAYNSHQLTMNLEHSFKNRITGNINYGYTATYYLNRDSSSVFTTFRENDTHNLSAGLAYWVGRKIRLSVNYAYVRNNSNLAVKRTLTREEFEEGQRQQSNSLGGYSRHTLTTGFNLLF